MERKRAFVWTAQDIPDMDLREYYRLGATDIFTNVPGDIVRTGDNYVSRHTVK